MTVYLALWIGLIMIKNACTSDKSRNNRASSPEITKDSSEFICKELIAKYKKYIEDELNYCKVTTDCGIAYGTCPLGPFFIVNKENAELLEPIVKEVQMVCENCKYDMPQPPSLFKCKNFKCYPAVSENLTVIMLFRENCRKIVSLYSDDIIGKDSSKLDLFELLYRVIPEDDFRAINSSDPYSMNRVRVIIDKNGIVKSLGCDR